MRGLVSMDTKAADGDTPSPMPHANTETVRRQAEAWNARDLTGWLAMFRSDAEIDWSRSRAPFVDVYRGRAGLEAFWNEFWSTFDNNEITRWVMFQERAEALEAAGQSDDVQIEVRAKENS
jgi:ketosteroid isomerase-like protein